MGRSRRCIIALAVATVVPAVIWFTPAQADIIVNNGLTVSAVVVDTNPIIPNPAVQFTGLAATNSVVTITRNGTLVTTLSTGSGATFSTTLSDQPVGQVSYTISAVDTAGRSLSPVTFALNLTMGTTTVVSGVFLGPSIFVDQSAVKLGQLLTVAGATSPNSAVTLTVNSDTPLSYSVLSDAAGGWSKILNSQELGLGTHTASARTLYGGTLVSAESALVSFAVNPIGQCDGKDTADLNCDSRVNLTDFSILLYFWQTTGPSNARADINGDGRVNIVDFSIMLYQWTG